MVLCFNVVADFWEGWVHPRPSAVAEAFPRDWIWRQLFEESRIHFRTMRGQRLVQADRDLEVWSTGFYINQRAIQQLRRMISVFLDGYISTRQDHMNGWKQAEWIPFFLTPYHTLMHPRGITYPITFRCPPISLCACRPCRQPRHLKHSTYWSEEWRVQSAIVIWHLEVDLGVDSTLTI